MPWPEFEVEKGSIYLAGEVYALSRVIAEQKNRLIDYNSQTVSISVWELIKEENQIHNPAFVRFEDGSWLKGHTEQKRWPGIGGRPERQTIFYSQDRKFSFVINSIQISA